VAGLVYVSAVAPDMGESAFGLITSVPTPIGSELRPDKSGFLKLTPKGIAEDFAQDLSAKEIEVLTAGQVIHRLVRILLLDLFGLSISAGDI
jgi:hypothetical protein